MTSMLWRLASRSTLPLSAVYFSRSPTFCDDAEQAPAQQHSMSGDNNDHNSNNSGKEGMRPHLTGDFHGLFPHRQLWHPKLPYPLWDSNWDGREPASTGDKDEDRKTMRDIRNNGVTRHIILVRHGQYDESQKEDENRKLTPIGIQQAELTGKRLAEMLQGQCHIKCIRVSGMARAKETADIIASFLPGVEFVDPDVSLNEGRPSHHIPGGKATKKIIEATDAGHPRIEEAFRKYFYRQVDIPSSEQQQPDNPQQGDPANLKTKHEFEIIVCHANVIRYFLCRSLQLPPEAWLRYCPLNCSLTYLTIRPTGTVSCRMLGDIGHLPYSLSTFSQHQGFNW